MSKFLSVRCKCGQKTVVFSNAATEVKCAGCGAVVARPTGGKVAVSAKVMEVLQ